MKSHKQKLIDHLECFGIDSEDLDEENLDWWADEMWSLRSHWHPNKQCGYVTALVDPQHEGLRKKGHKVWCYGLSVNIPSSVEEAQSYGSLLLGKSFKNKVEEFVDKVVEIRDSKE